MVNNNTKKTTATVATVSESNIYVKQSDLDKMTLGSFRNDVGYISSSALSTWMKEHSYLSKNEITALINKANLVVIDSINKEYDEEAIARLNADMTDVKGEIVAIKDKLRQIDGDYIKADKESSLAKKTDIRIINSRIETINNQITEIGDTIGSMDYAKKSDIPRRVSQLDNDKGYLTEHQSLAAYAKKTDLSSYAKKSSIPDVSGLAEKSEIPTKVSQLDNDKGYLTKHQSLTGYAKLSDLKGLATKADVQEMMDSAEELDLNQFAQKTDLNKLSSAVTSISKSLGNYATKKEIPDVSKFITLDDLDIPSTDGLASKEWVESQGYLKNHQSLKDYVKTSQIKDMATKNWVATEISKMIDGSGEIDLSGFAKKTDIPTDYGSTTSIANTLKQYVKTKDLPKTDNLATREWVQDNFLSEAQDLSEYAKLTDLNKYVKTSSLSSTLSKYVKTGDVYSKADVNDRFLSKIDAASQYITKVNASREYVSKEEIKDYLRIEDYRGIRDMLDSVVINRDHIDKTEDEFREYIRDHKIFNGFYLIKDNKLCIVQGNVIIGVIKDGIPQDTTRLEWEED